MNHKQLFLVTIFSVFTLTLFSDFILAQNLSPENIAVITIDTTKKETPVLSKISRGNDIFSTSATTILSSEKVEQSVLSSFQSALQGKSAGVFVQSGSGKLAQAINVRIRGTSSIHGNNQPLYIVDGHYISDLFANNSKNEQLSMLTFLNPEDIESVEVIRDASAAALYGGRAASGVVIITTKHGNKSKTTFNFSSQIGFSVPTKKMDLLNRTQYLSLFKESFDNTLAINMKDPNPANHNVWGTTNYVDVLDLVFPYWRDPSDPTNLSKGPNTNWEDQIFRTGFIQNYNLSASGGDEKLKYYTSLSWSNQESFVIGQDFGKMTGVVSFDFKPNRKLSIELSFNPSKTKLFRVPNASALSSLTQIVLLPPLDPLYIPGTANLNNLTLYENPLISAGKNSAEFINSLGNISAQYNIINSLFFRAELGGAQFHFKELNNIGNSQNNNKTLTIDQNYSLNFLKDFGNKLNLTVKGGFRSNKNNVDVVYKSNTTSSSYSNNDKYTSYYLISSLNYKNRYYLDLIGRYDGTSRLGKDNRNTFFPFISLSWVAIEKDITKSLSFIDQLKLNTSYGITGNDQFSTTNLIISPTVDWQTIKHLNLGTELTLLNKRLTCEINYYIKKTSNIFFNKNLPNTDGSTVVLSNFGEIENKGWEFTINSTNFKGEFQWYTNFNIAFNKNRVSDLGGYDYHSNLWLVTEGYPVGVFYTKKIAGVNPANGDALFYNDATRLTKTNILSHAGSQVVGDPNPKFFGGLTNSFTYKGFDLSFMLQFVYGNDIFNGGFQWQADGSYFDNQIVDLYNNHWKKPGDNAKYPQPRFDIGNGYGISSMLIFDGSYIRLKDLTIGYTINSGFISKYKVNSFRLFLTGQNLLTFTNYPGWDPEAGFWGTGSSASVNSIEQGYDYFTPPQSRIITFGIQLGF